MSPFPRAARGTRLRPGCDPVDDQLDLGGRQRTVRRHHAAKRLSAEQLLGEHAAVGVARQHDRPIVAAVDEGVVVLHRPSAEAPVATPAARLEDLDDLGESRSHHLRCGRGCGRCSGRLRGRGRGFQPFLPGKGIPSVDEEGVQGVDFGARDFGVGIRRHASGKPCSHDRFEPRSGREGRRGRRGRTLCAEAVTSCAAQLQEQRATVGHRVT